MSNQEPTLTAAGIRYLLAIDELDSSASGVKSSDIAKRLRVTKPSVHTMIKKLCDKGYATQAKYEAVHLTTLGKQLAERYAQQYAMLYGRMEHSLGLTPDGCRNAACDYSSRQELLEDMRRLNKQLVPKGLRVIPLRYKDNRALIDLFRPSELASDL